jgi:hypothetical protein
MEAPSFSETQREAAAHTRLEADLLRLPGSQYSAVVEWLPYPGDIYNAAIAAEIEAPNTGVVVVLDAYRKEKAALSEARNQIAPGRPGQGSNESRGRLVLALDKTGGGKEPYRSNRYSQKCTLKPGREYGPSENISH